MKRFIFSAFIYAAVGCTVSILRMKQVISEEGVLVSVSILIGFFLLFHLLLRWIKKKYYNDQITFSEVFTGGLKIGVTVAVISAIIMFIYLSYIDRQTLESLHQTQEVVKQKIIDQTGSMPKMTENILKSVQSPIGIALAQFGIIIQLLFFSLISAAILKTRPMH